MIAITISHTAKYSKAHNMVTKDVEAFIRRSLPKLCSEFVKNNPSLVPANA